MITKAIPQSYGGSWWLVGGSINLKAARALKALWASHWSHLIIQMSLLLGKRGGSLACRAAGRGDVQLCLMWSKASNSVYADRGEQRERPSLDRGSHTRSSFSAKDESQMTISEASTPQSRHTSVKEGGRWAESFCTRLAAISDASLSFSNTAQAPFWFSPFFIFYFF